MNSTQYLKLVSYLLTGAVFVCSNAGAAIDCTDTVPIYEIQGASHVSPYADQRVETCGVVTAVAFGGYYIQDPEGDGNPATSDGLYIVQSGDKPSVGTHVRLADVVTEFIPGGPDTGNLSITNLTSPDVLLSEEGAALPAPVVVGATGRQVPNTIVISDAEITPPINLQNRPDAEATPFNPDVDAIDFYESLEGMLVTVPDPVAVSAIRQFGRFSAEVFVLADNGSGIAPVDARSSNRGILLQPDVDNRGDQNPERIQIQFDGTLFGSTDYPSIKTGDRLGDVTGVMSYSFGNFEIAVLGPVEVTDNGLQPGTANVTGGADSVTVASYNVLNLSAVADDDEQRNKIAQQISSNLNAPDIIALQEIQDNNGDTGNCANDAQQDCANVLDASRTLERLVDAIADQGGPVYNWLNVDPLVETTDDNRDNPDTFGGVSLGNIRNAFLYNAARVNLVQVEGLTRDVLASRSVTVAAAFDTSRDPLEAVFEFNGNELIVINNHFSSRFGSSPIFGGPQPFVQAGEESREQQSQAMFEVTKWHLAENPDANVVVLGDLNTFEFTNDLTDILPAADGTQLLTQLAPENDAARYSFIFEGNSQSLDHVLSTGGIASGADIDYVHVNVDFPRRTDDIVASDHEPLVARISFSSEPPASIVLTSTVYSNTALELFWERDSRAAAYRVFRDGELLDTRDGLSFFEEGLQPGTRYFYEVYGVDTNGDITVPPGFASIETFSPESSSGVPEVLNLSGAVYSSTAIELFWKIADSAPSDITFDIFRDGELIDTLNGRSFFEEGLQPGAVYDYIVRTVDSADRQSPGKRISLQTNPDPESGRTSPAQLELIRGSVYSSIAIELFWQPGPGSTAYQIYRNDVLLDTRDGRSFFEDGLNPDTIYRYRVVPTDNDGNQAAGRELVLETNRN